MSSAMIRSMNQKLSHWSSIAARCLLRFSERWAAQYWHDYPFGKTVRADRAKYHALWEAEKQARYPEMEIYEKQTGFAVDKAWLEDLALHTQIVIKDSPLCYQHGRVLYCALRTYLQTRTDDGRVIQIVETGTARGFSAIVMARALADGGRAGQIMTFDLLPHRIPMFWNCVDDLDGPKTREALLAPWRALQDSIVFVEGDSRITLPKMALGRIAFAFLDGAHTYHDVAQEIARIVPFQHGGDVIVFDDYSTNVFPGLVRAVDEACDRYGYDKTVLRSNDQRAYVVAVKR